MDFEIRYANNLDVLIAIYVDEDLPYGGRTFARRTFATSIYRTFADPKFKHLPPPKTVHLPGGQLPPPNFFRVTETNNAFFQALPKLPVLSQFRQVGPLF